MHDDEATPTEQRRTQLTEAALSILSTEGPRAVTVKNIARHVGITDGAVFRHFPDTQTLFEAAVDRFDTYLPELPSSDLPPLDRLKQMFVERATAVQEHPHILSLTTNDRLQQLVGPEAAKQVNARIQESLHFLTTCITEAQREGALDPAIAPKVIVWMITGVLRGVARSGTDPLKAWADVEQALFTSLTGSPR